MWMRFKPIMAYIYLYIIYTMAEKKDRYANEFLNFAQCMFYIKQW